MSKRASATSTLLFVAVVGVLGLFVAGCGSDEVSQGELPTASPESTSTTLEPETAMVPDVVGKSQQEAEQALRLAGFEVRSERRESPDGESGEVVEQSPSGGGEAEEGVAVVIVVVVQAPPPSEEEPSPGGPAPGYNLVQDPTGALTIEVPPSWGVQTGTDSEGQVMDVGDWSSVVGYLITSSITTAENMYAWNTPGSQPTAGAYIVASRELAQTYTDDELVYSGPFAIPAKCKAGPYEVFDRPPYSGKMQTWYCGSALAIYSVAAAPEGRECVVLLSLALPNEGASEAEREAVEHILDTFDADCAGIAVGEEDRHVELAGASASDPPG